MSASTERKNRQAAREAGTDKKTLARQEAEKKAAKSKRRWTFGSILVALLLVVILLLNTGFLYSHTKAASVGGESYSPAELNYYYITQYSNFLNNYGSYASLFGLDTSGGVAGLRSQECSMLGEGQTWRDYFLQNSLSYIQQVVGLKNYAADNGIALDADELAGIDEDIASATATAKASGYASLSRFFGAQYGTGVSEKTVRSLLEDDMLAAKALSQYKDSLSFSDEELEEYYASLNGSKDYFNYAYYYVAAEKLPVEGETAEGAEPETAVTEQTLLEAKMTAQAIETAYADGADIADFTERFNAAIEAEFDTASATVRSNAIGSGLGDLGEWLRDSARKAGDLTVVEDSQGEGYYVGLFLAREDNHYPTVSVRHILIKAVAGEDGTYSDEAKQAALDRVNEIKAEFESGDQSEESFAALAEQYSEDAGSNTKGGLYEGIYKGKTVDGFNDFCFAGHNKGDIGVAYGDNGTYAGYHLIYFIGEGDLYSNQIAHDALYNEAVDSFVLERTESAAPAELAYWAKLVG